MMKKLTSILILFLWNYLVVGMSYADEFKLTASDGGSQDRFGYSVSISGDYAIVGARTDGDNGRHSGSAYVFLRNGTTWTEQAKLIASDSLKGHGFGTSVSISRDYAIVGAPGDDRPCIGFDCGSAYVFPRNGTTWTEQQKLTASDGGSQDEFGHSVSISGDYTIIGTHTDHSAYVFLQNGTTWTEQQKLTTSDGTTGQFGASVSISGDYAIVGVPFDDDNGSESGSVYIYDLGGREKPATPWDVTGDGSVNVFDLVIVGSQFGQTGVGLSGDVNGDGQVNVFDLVIVGSHFGEEIAAAAPIE